MVSKLVVYVNMDMQIQVQLTCSRRCSGAGRYNFNGNAVRERADVDNGA